MSGKKRTGQWGLQASKACHFEPLGVAPQNEANGGVKQTVCRSDEPMHTSTFA